MAGATGSQVALWRTSTLREREREQMDPSKGLPQQGGCGVFRSRRERAQHGRDEQADRREGDQEDTGGDHPQERTAAFELVG